MDQITMISGEIIKGVIVQENKYYIYIKTEQHFTQEEIELFGKEFCEQQAITTIQLPKDEIAKIARA